ncbi:acid phosphatase/Vanadium-dependent haloperoxidase [Meredithblackwellia eburnea MCA 4105]
MGIWTRIVNGPDDERRNRMNLDSKTRLRLVASYLPDWILTVVLISLVLWFTHAAGHQREFSLTDTSIQHTFAVKERVPFQMAIIYAGAIPAGLMAILAVFWRRSFWDLHNALLGLLLALALATAVTNIVKVTVGRPRPDFIDRCQPLKDAINAIPYGLANVTVCTSDQTSNTFIDGFKSFPSGHSSFSFAGLGYLSLYWAGKMHLFDEKGHAIKAWIALVPLMGASLIAISRTMDNRHHWQDVTIGSILGMAMAYFSYSLYYPPLNSPHAHLPFAPRGITPKTTPSAPAPGLPPPATSYPPTQYAEEEYAVPHGTVPRPQGGVGGRGNAYKYEEVRSGARGYREISDEE